MSVMTTNNEKWQVGELIAFEDNDPLFDTIDEALQYATQQSEENYETPYGVWLLYTDTNHADLYTIVYEGEWYQK